MTQVTSINDVDVSGRRLLVRADLNVPLEDGKIVDATRIDRFAEGMRALLKRGARLVIMTHRGRPDRPFDQTLSNEAIRQTLSDALGARVWFSASSTGPSNESFASRLGDGEVLLCENVRFLKGETENDLEVARGLSRMGDFYVNDAFSSAHRAHASTEGITRFLPSFAGPMMVNEIDALSRTLETPDKPAVAYVGGAKVSNKFSTLTNLVGKLDKLIIGGEMANTFLYADGAPMGKSLYEPDQLDAVAELRSLASGAGCEILLPVDVTVSSPAHGAGATNVVNHDACPDDAIILDAGPKSVKRFTDALRSAKSILWNGPVGTVEGGQADNPTVDLAHEAARMTQAGRSVTVAGGGETVAALSAAGVSDAFSYVSTARGAFQEWLEGKSLPGVAALSAARHVT